MSKGLEPVSKRRTAGTSLTRKRVWRDPGERYRFSALSTSEWNNILHITNLDNMITNERYM